jgi:hypothetical protein
VGLGIRHFSAKADDTKEQKDTNVKESLQDTVRRMQQKDGANAGADESNTQVDDFMRKARESWSTFSDEVSKTWEDLLKSGDRKDINKKLIQHRPEDTAEGDKPFTGSVAVMVIDESEHLTAWERMQRRLAEAPIISGTWVFVFHQDINVSFVSATGYADVSIAYDGCRESKIS